MDKEGLIAYDSRATQGDYICSDSYNKCIRKGKVRLFFCGTVANVSKMLMAYLDKPEEDYDDSISCSGIIVDGCDVYRVYIVDGSYGQEKENKKDFIVEGSGGAYAAGALHAGCNARQAVKIAIKCDSNSGGRVRTYQVPEE